MVPIAVHRIERRCGMTMCECQDPGCECGGTCYDTGTRLLFRVDYEDLTGMLMCDECAEDAAATGLFNVEE